MNSAYFDRDSRSTEVDRVRVPLRTLRKHALLQLGAVTRSMYATGFWRAGSIVGICRFFYRVLDPQDIVCVPSQGNKMLVNTKDRNISPYIVLTGTYEEMETRLLYQLLKPGMVVVDVGANAGYYTLIAAGLVCNLGKVYAFEPEPTSYRLLLMNVKSNGYTNVATINKALSDRQGTARLFTDRINLGGSSLSQANVANFADALTVETTTLDSYFGDAMADSRIDILKIDAQGAEGKVIQGAVQTLARNNLKVIMEFWPYGIASLGDDPLHLFRTFSELGFHAKLVDEKRATIRPLDNRTLETMCEKRNLTSYSTTLFMEKQSAR